MVSQVSFDYVEWCTITHQVQILADMRPFDKLKIPQGVSKILKKSTQYKNS